MLVSSYMTTGLIPRRIGIMLGEEKYKDIQAQLSQQLRAGWRDALPHADHRMILKGTENNSKLSFKDSSVNEAGHIIL